MLQTQKQTDTQADRCHVEKQRYVDTLTGTKAGHNTGTHGHVHTWKIPQTDSQSQNAEESARLLGLLQDTENICVDIGVHLHESTCGLPCPGLSGGECGVCVPRNLCLVHQAE